MRGTSVRVASGGVPPDDGDFSISGTGCQPFSRITPAAGTPDPIPLIWCHWWPETIKNPVRAKKTRLGSVSLRKRSHRLDSSWKEAQNTGFCLHFQSDPRQDNTEPGHSWSGEMWFSRANRRGSRPCGSGRRPSTRWWRWRPPAEPGKEGLAPTGWPPRGSVRTRPLPGPPGVPDRG